MQPLTMNLCNLPSWVISTPEFNETPKPIEIQGVRRAHRQLFERLPSLPGTEARAKAFLHHMDVAFQLHQWESETSVLGRKSLKNSYLRFLRGWMFDSNSVEGAVLKGWVESRIGIPPTFHKEPIEDVHSESYGAYLIDRMRGTARTSAIQAQFDLLYEFVQEELRLRGDPPVSTLFRGIHDFSEHRLLARISRQSSAAEADTAESTALHSVDLLDVASTTPASSSLRAPCISDRLHPLATSPGGKCGPKGKRNRMRLRLNNLNSFTPDFERAFEFGNRVLEVRVPACKVFFRADLLPGALLKGEEEVLVIGGDFDVIVRTG